MKIRVRNTVMAEALLRAGIVPKRDRKIVAPSLPQRRERAIQTLRGLAKAAGQGIR